MPLILSSNVIWHAYRLIAETKIFRLGLSLICLVYVKKEWIGKKYNTDNNNHIFYILQVIIRYNILLQIQRIFWHFYNKWSILIIQYISTLNLHLLYTNIWLYMNIYVYVYIWTLYMWTLCFLFIATLSQHIHTMAKLVSHGHNLFQLVLLDHCH